MRAQPDHVAALEAHLVAKGAVPPGVPSLAASLWPGAMAAAGLHARGIVPVTARVEAELATADGDERRELLASLGLPEPALAPVARLAYQALGLQSFYTAGLREVRGWPVPVGATALAAARAIHSDLARGFVRAEVFSLADLAHHGSEAAVRRAGALRTEGKGYILQPDDIVHILSSV
jgi:ribosome-binding ATPase